MRKRLLTLTLAGILAMSALTGCGSLKGDESVATVGKDEITADLANFYARYTQAQYETYYAAYLGDDMWNTEAAEGNTYEDTVKDSVLESLENMVILEQHMSDQSVELTDEEKSAIQKSAKSFDESNALDEKKLVSGNKETVERVLTLMTIQQKMLTSIEAGADTEVSDEEAAMKSMDYVEFSFQKTDDAGNSEDVTDDEKKQLKEQADTLAAGLAEGQDFETLAAAANVEVKKATFNKESSSPDAALIEAADALDEGGVTEVIEGSNGYYVARVTSLLDREATDNHKQQIVQQRKSDLYTETLNGWRDKTDIEVHKNVWKKISFKKLTVTMKIEEEIPYTDPVQTDDQAEGTADGE